MFVASFFIVIGASMNILFIMIEVIVFSSSLFVSLAHVPKVMYFK